jgi:hypothetical protein
MGVDFFDGLSNLLKPGNSALAFSISRATQTLLRRPETGRTQRKKKAATQHCRRFIWGTQSRIADVQRQAQQASVGGVLVTHLVAIASLVK